MSENSRTDETATDLLAVAFPPLDLGRPAGEQIFSALKSAILKTELPPGCLISESEIGQRFGASRTPVREAFTQLRADGLIVTLPSRGNYVSRLSEVRIREAQFIREGLELANVERLCEIGLRDTAASALTSILDAQSRCVACGDLLEFQEQDDLFHIMLARATGFARAETLLVREKAALDRLRVFSLSDVKHMTCLLEEHRAILNAIRERDTGSALAATRVHLRSILGALSSLIQANRDFFE
ncbi:GntR family transcriptional regulator [Nitratireductor luteus]|uniref:GntR family transcriptional regulator n=1 Tax=Nitratireductor luteus TaxID=2976980 RepID=UPI0022409D81|nr:GntR family transcriptional regulator [Nitratireductor luteus]